MAGAGFGWGAASSSPPASARFRHPEIAALPPCRALGGTQRLARCRADLSRWICCSPRRALEPRTRRLSPARCRGVPGEALTKPLPSSVSGAGGVVLGSPAACGRIKAAVSPGAGSDAGLALEREPSHAVVGLRGMTTLARGLPGSRETAEAEIPSIAEGLNAGRRSRVTWRRCGQIDPSRQESTAGGPLPARRCKCGMPARPDACPLPARAPLPLSRFAPPAPST